MSLKALSFLAVGLQLSSFVEAHVRLLYTGVPIRNAGGANLDGTYSVAGPCGGVQTWGKNGAKTVKANDILNLKIAYNGGHQDNANAFQAALSCDSTLATSDAVLKQAANLLTTAASPYTVPKVSATDSSTKGYSFAIQLQAQATGAKCTLSLLDQRNWGGCVDLMFAAADTSTTAAPMPSTAAATLAPGATTGKPVTTMVPATTLAPVYLGDAVSGTWRVATGDCNADDTVPDCCCMQGSISVSHAANAQTALVSGSLTLSATPRPVSTATPAPGTTTAAPQTCPTSATFMNVPLAGDQYGVFSSPDDPSTPGAATLTLKGVTTATESFKIQGAADGKSQWTLTNISPNRPIMCSMKVAVAVKPTTSGASAVSTSVTAAFALLVAVVALLFRAQ